MRIMSFRRNLQKEYELHTKFVAIRIESISRKRGAAASIYGEKACRSYAAPSSERCLLREMRRYRNCVARYAKKKHIQMIDLNVEISKALRALK